MADSDEITVSSWREGEPKDEGTANQRFDNRVVRRLQYITGQRMRKALAIRAVRKENTNAPSAE
jgi:hypothetical protein